MIAASEALQRLSEGNTRFVSGEKTAVSQMGDSQRSELVVGQEPYAVILGCSDSRVPVEIIFDQGLGDLFVTRVAGNILDPAIIGTIEFAAERLNARLVVVLGHSNCSAVGAAVDQLLMPTEGLPEGWHAVIDRIRPSVEELQKTDSTSDRDVLKEHAVRANIRASAEYLKNESKILRRLIHEDGLIVLGAEYSLETGVVDFFDGSSESG